MIDSLEHSNDYTNGSGMNEKNQNACAFTCNSGACKVVAFSLFVLSGWVADFADCHCFAAPPTL
jgi:hypothetical protein